MYEKLMEKFVQLAEKGDKQALEVIEMAQRLATLGVNSDLKSKVDSKSYVDLMGIYKKLAFEGRKNLSFSVLDAAYYLMQVGDVSKDAAYAGAVL